MADTFAHQNEITGLTAERDWEQARADRLQAQLEKADQVLRELKKFSHFGQCRFIVTKGVKSCDCPKEIVGDYFREKEKKES